MTVSEKKATGSFFTPIELARLLARWAICSALDRVLEPSCGEGVFLRAAIERLRELEATPDQVQESLWAVEAQVRPLFPWPDTSELDVDKWFGQFILGDFFEIPAPGSSLFPGRELPTFDVVLGNPPYVRYQLFNGALREKALACARENGVVLPKLASMWAPFLCSR
jgi:type I restriction-modification system DNA methylase subunit